ncbi:MULTISPECIES: terminase small subunit [Clostridium]|uniref:terminase small subunit n=1 Tax=Clostridium TaxID=1485 RepID=UPI000825A085|nr:MULTISPECIES: terminase small subunit [Clostridium]PJI07053.1 phage portal protein [Clostridium sp. CT7]
MPRQRSPNRDKAFLIYKQHKGNIKLREIARILQISEKTISGWKAKDKWEYKLNGTMQKKSKKNTELTDKQKLFCAIYAKKQNATKAYQRAYKCTYETAMAKGCRALKNPKIKHQINALLDAELSEEFLKKGLIQKYKDIAFSDIGDYLEFGKKFELQWTKNDKGEGIPVIDPSTGEQKVKEYSYVNLKDSANFDTSLITEVSEGKYGIKIKLPDKLKAMSMLVKLSNLLSNEEKVKFELEYKKLVNEKIKAEINSMKGNDNDKSCEDIENFIEATRPGENEIKELFKDDENEKEKED